MALVVGPPKKHKSKNKDRDILCLCPFGVPKVRHAIHEETEHRAPGGRSGCNLDIAATRTNWAVVHGGSFVGGEP